MEQKNHGSPSFINIAVLLLFAIVIAVASAVTTYFVLNSRSDEQYSPSQSSVIPPPQTYVKPTSAPVEPTQTNVDEMVSWKVYVDKKYDYEFKYPNNWDLISIPNESLSGSYNLTISKGFNKDDIQIVKEMYGLNADDSIKNRNSVLKMLNNSKYTKLPIIGGEGYYYVSETPAGSIPAIYLVSDKEIFIMGYNIFDSSLASAETLFKQILSTFKFLE